MPATAFAMIAQTGDVYFGLWYPVVIALTAVVIGLFMVPETKDRDILADDAAPPRRARHDEARHGLNGRGTGRRRGPLRRPFFMASAPGGRQRDVGRVVHPHCTDPAPESPRKTSADQHLQPRLAHRGPPVP